MSFYLMYRKKTTRTYIVYLEKEMFFQRLFLLYPDLISTFSCLEAQISEMDIWNPA